MAATVQLRGRYELFETRNHNRILVLDRDRWYAWVQGEQGEVLVRSDPDHERQRTLQDGEYYLVDFTNDPRFTDLPHLFLQRGERFQEVILPNGLPTDDDVQKKVILADATVDMDELPEYLEAAETDGRARAGSDGERTEDEAAEEKELPIPGFRDFSVRDAMARLDDMSEEDLRRLRSWEVEHKQRKSLLQQIDRRLR
ncbi:MAG TPA: hypothetical protein VF981_12765 [Gemmatimonadaceae bacterium]